MDWLQISIASVQPFDSGMLHCVLPNGARNSIKLIVHGRKIRAKEIYILFQKKNAYFQLARQTYK